MSRSLSEMTLDELWQLFPIILQEYNPKWPLWYEKEARHLKKIFGNSLKRIRHIGSTSVPGLAAKPTIDILLEATNDTSAETLRALGISAGYLAMAETKQGEYRLDLCKGYTSEGFAERVFHLHIRYQGDWDEPIFCDYLRRHPDCMAEYAKLKRELQPRFAHNRDGYTEAKGEFIRHWTQIARQERELNFPSP